VDGLPGAAGNCCGSGHLTGLTFGHSVGGTFLWRSDCSRNISAEQASSTWSVRVLLLFVSFSGYGRRHILANAVLGHQRRHCAGISSLNSHYKPL
jgi:hypothetical protein